MAVLQKRNASINKRYRNAQKSFKKFKETHKNNVRNRMNSTFACRAVVNCDRIYTARAMFGHAAK